MESVSQCLAAKNKACDKLQAIKTLEDILLKTKVNQTSLFRANRSMAVLHKPSGSSGKSIDMYLSDAEGSVDEDLPNRKLRAYLPKELKLGPNDTVAFWSVQLPEEDDWEGLKDLYKHTLIGLSVDGMDVSGLTEPVKITISITANMNETVNVTCVYLNTKENDTIPRQCDNTEYNETHATCFSSHLTYFGVLMVSADLSPKDAEILFYITYIGCGISLLALVITVLFFITNRKLRGDDSKKIHISLAVALILLNVHFLSSQAAAASSSTELCLYVALLLHYSLLASFTWMALEGFHLYLLLVKVFNVYVRRYLLKLSVVGWGLPAVIVSVVVIIDKNLYGRTSVMSSRPNETEICYITDDRVKLGTTLGLFSIMFLFNVIMFGVTIKWFVSTHFTKQHGQRERRVARKEIVTLLVLMVLLGLSWGLIFFSLGQLPAPGLYVFCILNSLQGFFIFIYFMLHLKNSGNQSATPSPGTQVESS
ncbi:adhesion G-protein coupled receptor G2-like [Poecilia reticulata]|uniref:adhesion G-protein coupled receptor G2-like n=1 Tax=Poecilia reticulata TaxID=8081 RepID=UPI0004A3AEFC|nr:PREDICTED: adhesion G-protein coupled receptor G2-like [Poecilia reticulata]